MVYVICACMLISSNVVLWNVSSAVGAGTVLSAMGGGHYYVDMYHLHMYFVRLYVLGVGAVLCWAVLSARRIGAVLW